MPGLRISLFASFLAVLSGVLTIVLWSIGLRWVAFLALFWCTVLGLGLLRWFDVQVEKLLLCTFVLANSIRMDVHVVFSKSGFGFPLGLGEVALVSLLILWAIRARRDPHPTQWPKRFVFPLALALFGAVISVLQTPDLPTCFRMPLFVAENSLLFFYLWNLRLEEKEWRRLTVGIAIALALQGIIGGLQGATQSTLGLEFFGSTNAAVDTKTFTSFSRVGGTLGQPNRFAIFVNASIFTTLAMVLWAKSWRGRIGYVVVFCMAFGALIMTQSRGGWLGFAFAFVPFAYFALRERMARFFSVFTIGCILGSGAVFIVAFPPIYERLTAEDQNSATSRIPMSLTALRMIRDNPFGVGFTQYVPRMSAYDVTQDGLSYRFRFPVHNAYLLLAAEQGIWVLVVYLVLIAIYYRDVIRLVLEPPGFPRVLGLAFAAGMLAVHLHINLEISHVMVDPNQWFSMGMAMCVLRHLRRRPAEQAVPAVGHAPPLTLGPGREGVPAAG